MKLAQFSVKNSLLVNLLSFLIIVIGIFSVFHLRKEAFPQVDYDIATITTFYPGAPTEDVEKLVTIPIEKEIKGIRVIFSEMISEKDMLCACGDMSSIYKQTYCIITLQSKCHLLYQKVLILIFQKQEIHFFPIFLWGYLQS